MDTYRLNSGYEMPVIGIGTFILTPDEAEKSVAYALESGYRLIDTANAYVNEKAVGRGMRKSGVTREEVFLETKLWPTLYQDETAVDKNRLSGQIIAFQKRIDRSRRCVPPDGITHKYNLVALHILHCIRESRLLIIANLTRRFPHDQVHGDCI